MATSKFGSAFSEARKSGAKTFEFGGKKFTTDTKEEATKKAGSAVTAKYESLRKAPVGADTGAMRKSADTAARKFSGTSAPAPAKAAAPKDYTAAHEAGRALVKLHGAAEKNKARGASDATLKSLEKKIGQATREYELQAPGMRKGGKVKPKKRMI